MTRKKRKLITIKKKNVQLMRHLHVNATNELLLNLPFFIATFRRKQLQYQESIGNSS